MVNQFLIFDAFDSVSFLFSFRNMFSSEKVLQMSYANYQYVFHSHVRYLCVVFIDASL